MSAVRSSCSVGRSRRQPAGAEGRQVHGRATATGRRAGCRVSYRRAVRHDPRRPSRAARVRRERRGCLLRAVRMVDVVACVRPYRGIAGMRRSCRNVTNSAPQADRMPCFFHTSTELPVMGGDSGTVRVCGWLTPVSMHRKMPASSAVVVPSVMLHGHDGGADARHWTRPAAGCLMGENKEPMKGRQRHG